MRSYMKYNTVIYGFYRAKKGIDFGKSLFVLEGILSINNKSDMTLFQNFCCRILRLYVSSINQHKKLQVIAG